MDNKFLDFAVVCVHVFGSMVISLYIYLYSYKDVHADTLITVKLQILNAVKNVFTIVGMIHISEN